MARKLYYFDLKGLGESIRYLLHYSKVKFEDVRYDRSTWPDKNVKGSLPFGQLPIYEEDGRTLNQSLAIARYIASQNNLLPSDPWEQATLDAVVFTIYDFWAKVVAYLREQDSSRKEELKKTILKENIDFFFSRFEKELKANNGVFGRQLSWADFILVGITEAANVALGEQIQKKYPTVEALVQKIRAFPGVREYIASRKS